MLLQSFDLAGIDARAFAILRFISPSASCTRPTCRHSPF